MFFPSRALARREAQMGSSSIEAAVVRATILSDYAFSGAVVADFHEFGTEREGTCVESVNLRGNASKQGDAVRTVISTLSSARMRAA